MSFLSEIKGFNLCTCGESSCCELTNQNSLANISEITIIYDLLIKEAFYDLQ